MQFSPRGRIAGSRHPGRSREPHLRPTAAVSRAPLSAPSIRALSSDVPPVHRAQVRNQPSSGYLPTGGMPRLEDGTIVVNYSGPYSPRDLKIFLDVQKDLQYLKFSRAPDDQMKLYAEIRPGVDFNRFQLLLGAVRSLSLIGEIKAVDAD